MIGCEAVVGQGFDAAEGFGEVLGEWRFYERVVRDEAVAVNGRRAG